MDSSFVRTISRLRFTQRESGHDCDKSSSERWDETMSILYNTCEAVLGIREHLLPIDFETKFGHGSRMTTLATTTAATSTTTRNLHHTLGLESARRVLAHIVRIQALRPPSNHNPAANCHTVQASTTTSLSNNHLHNNMGKHNLTPLRVASSANLFMRTVPPEKLLRPAWFPIITDFPPSAPLVRTPAVQHRQPARPGPRATRKASRMFMPQRITHPEDQLRRDFFGDHPWELARPRVLLEDDGRDALRWDWSLARQPGRPVDGERLVLAHTVVRLSTAPCPLPSSPQPLPALLPRSKRSQCATTC